MVYLLADWGMGDSETLNQKYVEKSRDLLRPQQSIEEQREVDLHPLSNQVIFLYLFIFMMIYFLCGLRLQTM